MRKLHQLGVEITDNNKVPGLEEKCGKTCGFYTGKIHCSPSKQLLQLVPGVEISLKKLGLMYRQKPGVENIS